MAFYDTLKNVGHYHFMSSARKRYNALINKKIFVYVCVRTCVCMHAHVGAFGSVRMHMTVTEASISLDHGSFTWFNEFFGSYFK